MIQRSALLIMIGVAVLSSCKQVSPSNIVGQYATNNYDEPPFLAEVPYYRDTLHLKKDLSFSSSFYGKGTYELSDNVIHLKSTTGYHGSISLPIRKRVFGTALKLVLSHDLNYYYKKIN